MSGVDNGKRAGSEPNISSFPILESGTASPGNPSVSGEALLLAVIADSSKETSAGHSNTVTDEEEGSDITVSIQSLFEDNGSGDEDTDEGLEACYAVMRRKAHLSGLGASPFLPQSVTEYKVFREQLSRVEKSRSKESASALEQGEQSEQVEQVEQTEKSEQGAPPPLRPAFRPSDGLSCVLAKESIFVDGRPPPSFWDRVEWPSALELRNSGRSRPCSLPRPRFNRLYRRARALLDNDQNSHRYAMLSNYRLKDLVPEGR